MTIIHPYRFLISGGGTGGHIYPALAIADELRLQHPDAEVLFVGANGRMEMEKIPQAGYQIVGIDIAGFNRKHLLKNLSLPFKILRAIFSLRKTFKTFKPDIVIGVGGYVTGPTLRLAIGLRYPSLIQEQNSYPGVTNKILGKKVDSICLAYPGLEKFFPAHKIALTGNPLRNFNLNQADLKQIRATASEYFSLDANTKTALIMGGSLGSRTLNESMKAWLTTLASSGYQFIWQTGKNNYSNLELEIKNQLPSNVKMLGYLEKMDYAYALADVVVSRAGAISISELALLAKPVILVPSPNVAEDHQTKNAMALVKNEAAILVIDAEAKDVLIPTLIELLEDNARCESLSHKIYAYAKPNAAKEIVEIAINLIENKRKA
ncbi:MAG: undecaprenyldiphospho-muramoylpentapeptide beta-N-acetylglucosaminyltransferase [Bacteroidota bacterium]|nr:undecaprenyldiphospho-muramoylpentapeptide beta-N-acetylglucosaminyltransferase [Bacteroidota bacterium]